MQENRDASQTESAAFKEPPQEPLDETSEASAQQAADNQAEQTIALDKATPAANAVAQAQASEQKTSETTPLVLGILSILFASIVGLVLGIIGMNMSKKALDVVPDSSKAKAGRICSIVGIVLSIISIIATIALFAIFGAGIGIASNETNAVNKAAAQTLDEITNPDDSDRLRYVKLFDTVFTEKSGISLADLGVNYDDFSTWLFDGAGYTITNTTLNTENDTATALVTADITAHSLTDLSTVLAKKIDAIDLARFSSATSSDALYSLVGAAFKEAMNETPTATRSATLAFVKLNGRWQIADGSDQALVGEIFGS